MNSNLLPFSLDETLAVHNHGRVQVICQDICLPTLARDYTARLRFKHKRRGCSLTPFAADTKISYCEAMHKQRGTESFANRIRQA